jgi:predicted PurR-regulated permease PerM
MTDTDPRLAVRRWVPHLAMLGLVLLSVGLVVAVLRPVASTILTAAALALLTGPILFEPLYAFAERVLPKASPGIHRQAAGIGATVILVGALLLPLVLFLVTTVGSINDVAQLAVGIATDDPAQLDRLQQIIQGQVDVLDRMYPDIDLAHADVAGQVRDLVQEARGVGPAMLDFLFRGTGRVAQAALALVSLAFFVAEGPNLVRALLELSPLASEQERDLVTRYRQTVLRLLADTIGSAAVKGVTLAAIAWTIDAVIGFDRTPFLPVALLASFLTLLPLVGATIVWLPLAVILWTGDHHVAAGLLAVLSIVSVYGIEEVRRRIAARFDDHGSWLSFLLFLSLIGGVLGFGFAGLVIGPVAVVLLVTLGSFWWPLYAPRRPQMPNK